MPFDDDEVSQGETCGKVQSSKWVGKLVSPISGEIVEVNEELEDSPELVNQDPYGAAWFIRIAISDPAEVDDLMDAQGYEEYLTTLDD